MTTIQNHHAVGRAQAELAASSLDARFESLDDVADDAEVETRLAEVRKQGASSV